MSKKIKSVTSFRSDIGVFGKDVVNPYYIYRLKEFDKSNNLLSECELKQNGLKEWETILEYDAQNRIISRTTYYPGEDTMEKTVNHYDETGNKVKEENFFGEDIFEVNVYFFNINGKIITQVRKDDEDTEIEKQELAYNEEGQMIKQLFYVNGEPEREIVYHYDETGFCTSEIHSNLLSSASESIDHSYNTEGKKINSTTKDASGNIIGYLDIEYDDRMNPVKYTTETSGFYNSKAINEITYDDKGRVTGNEYFDVLNNYLMSKEQLWLDDDGNIIEEEIFEINPQSGMKKTHYRSKIEYDFFVE